MILSSLTSLINNLIIFLLAVFSLAFLVSGVLWFLKLLLRGVHSLNVVPIVNETGLGGEIEGVAAGIDDILISKIQDIAQKSTIPQIKHYWLAPIGAEKDRQTGLRTSSQYLDIAGGDVSIDLHKLGDFSIGPVKIPLGSIVAFLSKVVGGTYVSGALQKYGRINKIVLKMEQRQTGFSGSKRKRIKFKRETKYFEATWPDKDTRTADLAEGVPIIIEELAYRISLHLAGNLGTENWRAYRSFLNGILAFRDFEENRTRKDRLRDAINCWRESVRLDSDFDKANYNLGIALDLDGKYEDAIFRYQEVTRTNSEIMGAESHYNLAKIYWDIYRDEVKTFEELGKAKELDKELAEIYHLRGLIHFDLGRYKQAVVELDKAIAMTSKKNAAFLYIRSLSNYYLGLHGDQGCYKKALDDGVVAGNILKEEEKTPSYFQTMGWIHNQLQQYDKALGYFKKGLKKSPTNRDILDGYGEALKESGEVDKSLIIYRRLARLYPEYGRGYEGLSKSLKLLNADKADRYSDEIEAYDAVALALNKPDLLEIKDAKIFIDVMEDKIQPNERSSLQQNIFAGIIAGTLFYQFKNSSLAADYFEKWYKPLPAPKQSVLMLEHQHIYCMALIELGYFYDATTFMECISYSYDERQEYDIAQAFDNLAEALVKNGEFEVADRAYKEAIIYYKKENLLSQASEIHVRDAECLMDWYWQSQEGNARLYDWAEQECNEAIHLNPSNHGAFHVKGNTYYDFREYAKAIAQYEKTIAINFDLANAHYNLGLCYEKGGNFAEAAKKFETVIKLKEFHADPLNEGKEDPYSHLAACLEKEGKLEEAIHVTRTVANLFPRSVKYNLSLAEYVRKSGELAEAASILQATIDIDKKDEQRLRHRLLDSLADMYAELGANWQEAFAMIIEALAIVKERLRLQKQRAGAFQKIKKAEKELLSIRHTLGWICYQGNRAQRAILLLERTLSEYLGDPRAHGRLALAYEKYIPQNTDKKDEYEEKALAQWRIIASLETDGMWGEIAEERLEVYRINKKLNSDLIIEQP